MIRTSGDREVVDYLGYNDGGLTETDRRHARHLAVHGPFQNKVSQRLCEEIRRRRHNGESGESVYESLPVEMSRALMDDHAAGRCPHPHDVPPVDADGQLSQVQCALLRVACWRGVTQREASELPEDTVDQTTVWLHVTGNCNHVCGIPPARQETVTAAQCRYWRDQRDGGVALSEVASSTTFSESTVSKHTCGRCEHD